MEIPALITGWPFRQFALGLPGTQAVITACLLLFPIVYYNLTLATDMRRTFTHLQNGIYMQISDVVEEFLGKGSNLKHNQFIFPSPIMTFKGIWIGSIPMIIKVCLDCKWETASKPIMLGHFLLWTQYSQGYTSRQTSIHQF